MKLFVLVAALVAQPLVSDDFLEPSVRNEVDHALSMAARRLASPDVSTSACARVDCPVPFSTNGLTATDLAVRLVSSQRADGSWSDGTNDWTRSAVRLLDALL